MLNVIRYFFLGLVFCSMCGVSIARDRNKMLHSSSADLPITKKVVEEQAVFIEGMQAYILGNNIDAIARFNEVLKRDPRNDAAMYVLAKIAYVSGNMDKVIEYAEAAIKINPDNEYYYQYLAEAKGEKKDFLGASNTYERLIKLRPKDYDYYYDWAYMLTKADRLKEAIEAYNLLEVKTGVQEEIIFQKQPLWIKLGRIEESIKDIEKLVKLYPSETRYVGLIGEIYQANKMYEKAIQTYERMLAADANNSDALLAMAETYRKKGDQAKHDEIIQKLFNSKDVGIDAKILTFIPYIEKLARDSSIKEEVLKMADMIVAAHPNNVKATTARADVLYNIGRKKEAQSEYSKVIRMSDVPATVWMQLYILNFELEEFDTLIACTQQGMDKYPRDAFGYFYNALAHQQLKQFSSASKVLLRVLSLEKADKEKAVSLPPQLKLQMLISLGDVSYEIKNYERSDSAYEAALEIDPNNATVLNNYAYYLSERADMLEKAERMSKKANLLVDNNSAYMDTYAWIMYKMKNYTEALEWMEQVMQLSDAQERPELLIHYGDILFQAGQKDRAREQWQKAINKGGDKLILEEKIQHQ